MLISLSVEPIAEQLVGAEISFESLSSLCQQRRKVWQLETPPQRALSSAWHCPEWRKVASSPPQISFCKRSKARTDASPHHMQQGFNQTLALTVNLSLKITLAKAGHLKIFLCKLGKNSIFQWVQQYVTFAVPCSLCATLLVHYP